MFFNYLKIASRNIFKQKAYSAINIMGLAIGIASCILVGLFIWQEFNYDSYHERASDIYRISRKIQIMSQTNYSVETPALTAPTLAGQFPEIDKLTRIFFSDDDLIKYNDVMFYEDEMIYADSTFFDIFSYNVLRGNPKEFLRGISGVVITTKIAEKYFGSENPVGKILNVNNKYEFEVQGVIEDVPVNSHFTFDIVANYNALYNHPAGNYIEQWGATFGSYTYLLCKPGSDIHNLEKKTSEYLSDIIPFAEGTKLDIVLQPLEDIHLYSNMEDEINPNSSISNIVVLISIVFFILILAAINFINLTTARAVKRAKEIGLRKVLGAVKFQLVKQFLGESVLISFISLLVGLVLVELFKPSFSTLVGSELSLGYLDNPGIIAVILLGTIILGMSAGLYPSFVLTHFQPAKVLKGNSGINPGIGTGLLRKGLVVFQFSISIILIIITLLMNKQIGFMRSFEMGFEKDHTIIIETPERMGDKYETIKNELNNLNGVITSSACLGVPVYDSGFGTSLEPSADKGTEPISISVKMIDDDYNALFGLELLSGRMLSELSGADFTKVTVINETLARKLGYSDPGNAIGKVYRIGLNGYNVEVVGVIKDFHFSSVHEEVKPLIFLRLRRLFQELAIKINSTGIPSTLIEIESVWNNFYPGYPFAYSFLDEKIDALYKAEERSFQVITTFSLLAILIACLGLLGLTFYSTEQRRKEIGVRKVLGATVPNLVNIVTFEFMKLILLANLIAWPVSYYLINKWLLEFPYRTSVSLDLFIQASFWVILIAFLTISYTVVKSAVVNPIDTLKYE